MSTEGNKTQRRPRHQGATGLFQPDSDVHLLDRLNVVYKYRRVALSVFLLIILGSLLRTYTTVPMYQAQGRLLIELEDERTAAVAGAMTTVANDYQDPEPYFNTQFRILTGRDLGRRVAAKLSLAKVREFGGEPQLTSLGGMLATMRQQVEAPFRSLFGLSGAGADTASGPPDEAALTGELLSRVSVRPVQNSRLVDVAFVSAEPKFAVLAANTLIEEYVDQNLELRRQNMARSLEWLNDELQKQQATVEASERALAQYREDQNALSLEDRQNIVVARLNQLNDAVTRAKTNRVQKEAPFNQIRALGPNVSPETIPGIAQNQFIQQIKTRLADLRRERTTLLERYGEKYPDVIKVNANIGDAERQLASELAKAADAVRNDYQSALSEERTLSAALEDQKGAAMDLNRKSVSYSVLEREAESNRQIYETLLQREKELQVLANSTGNNVRLIDRAELPHVPFTPRPSRDLLLATIAGLALALGLVLAIDYLDDTVKTPEDVTKKLRLTFLGLVPKVEGNDHPVLSGQVPHEFGEAFRSLRTSLVFSNGTESTRVLMVTSAQPLEGKTTTACNMAIALAFGGARVLLIDADMRRPGVQRTLGLQNGIGLSHLLTGQATPRQAIQKLENPDLWVMTAGTIPPNPSELLASDRMKTLVRNAQNGPFDWVVIDTPPVLAVTDAVIVAPMASGVAFVIGSEMTRRRLAERAIEALMTSEPRLLGAVLNRVDLARNKYYYARYYGYKNKNYYATPTAA
ncbi:MAG TPA: polysaccharide biosynthesis tyrosine autokinase [Candidatus Limnocylindrales bacterium]|nr:polysaccharide biosynthesis tyrosine autokinase [Candidatus Limnocylindrales bacterium]